MSLAGRLKVCAIGALLSLAAAGCSVLPPAPPAPVHFDFGPLPPPAAPAGSPATVQVTAPPWLDGTAMLYRLAYGDSARLASFRDSRWAAAPAALLEERLRQRLGRTGGAQAGLTLRLALEEFGQVFDAPARSRAVVRLRATLLEAGTGRVLRQAAFAEEAAAESADAAGGARALVVASDAASVRAMEWAAGPPASDARLRQKD